MPPLPDQGHLAYAMPPKPVLWGPIALAAAGAALLGIGASIDNAALGLPGLAILLAAIPAGAFALVRRKRRKWRVPIWPMVAAIALGVLLPPLEVYFWLSVQDANMARGPNPANQVQPEGGGAQ